MRFTPLIIAIVLIGCSDDRKTILPAVVIDSDTRPAFTLDVSKPFVIEFGRGSGWHGLDVIKIDGTGAVELHRIASGANIEAAWLRLSDAQKKELADLVNAQRLTSMGRTYTQPDVADGTQWVLWIQQMTMEKSVYFNNAFPTEIKAFAAGLDGLLENAGLSKASWTLIPNQQGIDQQAAVWARIQPAK